MALKLNNVKEHVVRFESDYTYHFREFPGFGAYFVKKDPRRSAEVHSFLRVGIDLELEH